MRSKKTIVNHTSLRLVLHQKIFQSSSLYVKEISSRYLLYTKLFGLFDFYRINHEKKLLQVPQDYSFVATFDLLFKLHHVLNFSFEDNLKTMMNFVQHYIYKMVRVNVKMTTHMIRVFNDFERSQHT